MTRGPLGELFLCPAPPDWTYRGAALLARHGALLEPLRACAQDPRHHAEGDVWTHLDLVLAALAADSDFRGLPATRREIVWAAAVLHDVAKPECSRIEDGHIRSPGHSRHGERRTRRLLYMAGIGFEAREQVAALVRHHQRPFYLLERDDPARLCYGMSFQLCCQELALLARADALGRRCHDQQRLLDHVALFAAYCAEQGCLAGPRAFASDHARFVYFRKPGADPSYAAYDDCRGTAVLLSGLPGAGKDRHLARALGGLAVVSLDALRRELDVDPADGQRGIVERARARARECLRAGQDFVWNATNLSRALRGQVIDLCAGYHARVRVVYLEVPYEQLLRQNQDRPSPVPLPVLDRLIDRWEPPDLTEAHELQVVAS